MPTDGQGLASQGHHLEGESGHSRVMDPAPGKFSLCLGTHLEHDFSDVTSREYSTGAGCDSHGGRPAPP